MNFPHDVTRVETGRVFECPHPCGLIPSYASNGSAVNGGVPQSPAFNRTLHFATLAATFERYVEMNETRLVDLDFESWNPIWEYNPNTSATYIASIQLVKLEHPQWTSTSQIEAEAKRQFETAALALLIDTAKAVRTLRPSIRIGFYSFPARVYWQGYNSSMGPVLRARNERLLPLYCVVDALFPSVYQFYNSENSSSIKAANTAYTFGVVAEAVRLAKLVPSACGKAMAPSVLAYTWHRYHDGITFLSSSDLIISWEQPYAAGAHGIVMWGSEPTSLPQFEAWYSTVFAPLANRWVPK
eukprot:CAMPEP_0182945296 /NCGR_PEP_ID=MMETSP0105_2-20130417/55349_1 /TAXON_ID=81532 ORGANISM="Acanthoeca-like sp., Strain 10tr" /NCGR_SAMPLE_ID=MMETSP0105_2 /ASSEMBLY_ACC=CAM_ASM_000205 /LENGTH=298 /DNA_ID=CAMNT_0025085311 /DNA_START=55 /DNA_END=951 /DNA_ORIENTATION=-